MKDVIASKQNPTVKRICALTDKKNRRAESLFRLDGIKLLREAARAGLSIVYTVVRMPADDSLWEEIGRLIQEGTLEESCLLPVTEAVFEKISEEKSPEGILAVARIPEALHQTLSAAQFASTRLAGERVLILESVRDPGNLGTVIRSAEALGLDRLILTDDCADLYHPRTVRGAMGALFRLPILTVKREALPTYIEELRRAERRLYATALHTDARLIGSFSLHPSDGFVIGNEGHGLSPEVIRACDGAAIIPMRAGAESLNAAAAAAICIWETARAGGTL